MRHLGLDVSDLVRQKTNDMLNLERENSRKFMEENFQLQTRLRDLEIFQACKKSVQISRDTTPSSLIHWKIIQAK